MCLIACYRILLVVLMNKTPRLSKKLAMEHQHFALLYAKFALPLTKFLMKRMGADQQATEEVFSRTIIAAWQGFQTFENKSNYFTWLCRIALNKMADYYREQVHERSVLVVPTLESWTNFADKDLTPDERFALNELRMSVRQCLGLLPLEKRQLLYLRYWREMSVKAIAEYLGISERAAEGKIYRAKVSLKSVMTKQSLLPIPGTVAKSEEVFNG